MLATSTPHRIRRLLGATVSAAIIGWVLSSPNSVQAQSAQEINRFSAIEDTLARQREAGQWSAARRTAQQLLEYCQQRRLPLSMQATALNYIGLVEKNMGNYQQSLEAYQQAVAACRQARPANRVMREVWKVVTFEALIGLGRIHRHMDDVDNAVTAFQEAAEHARRNDMPDRAASAGSDLGFLYEGEGMNQEALAEFQRIMPTLRGAAEARGSSTLARHTYADALRGMATSYMNLGRFNEAEPAARAGLAWTTSLYGQDHLFRAKPLKVLGLVYSYQNRYEEAAQRYEEGVRIFANSTGIDHPECLGIINNLAIIYVFLGQHERATEMAQTVLQSYRKIHGPDHRSTITSVVALANIYLQQGQYDDAAPLLTEAVETCRRVFAPDHPKTLSALRVQVCNEFLRGGDPAEILAIANEVLTGYETTSASSGDLANMYAMRARVRDRLDQRAEAIKDMERALKHAELQRALASGGDLERAKLFEDFNLFYGQAMVWHAERGSEGIAEAFAVAEQMKARSFMDVLHAAEFDFSAGSSSDQRAQRKAEEKRLRDAVTQAQQKYDALPDTSDETARRQAAAAVFAARDRLYDHLMTVRNASPTYRNLLSTGNQAANIKTVQSQVVDDRELILSYAAYGSRMFVFSIRKDSVEFTELRIDETQAEALGVAAGDLGEAQLSAIFLGDDGLLAALSNPAASNDLQTKLHTLWQLLIPEADRAALVDGSVDLLTVLPDGLIALLPLEALIVEQAEDGPNYLLDVGPPIAYAPSASVLLNLLKRESTPHDGTREPVFTLGDPAYARSDSDDSRAAQFRAGLSRLPFSGYEASWVAEHFADQGMSAVKLTGARATEAEMRRLITGREIVHLACHGLAEDRYGNFFGCLAVAAGQRGDSNDDGFLYTPEIYELDLDGCELAILSACQTNFGPQQTGEGVWTISRGFLVSGARRVVASNWVVDDEAGATLVSYFADYLADSEIAPGDGASSDDRRDYAVALQKAKRAVRRQGNWASPFYWGSLILVGPN